MVSVISRGKNEDFNSLRYFVLLVSLLSLLFLSACSLNKSTVRYPGKQNHLNAPSNATTVSKQAITLPAPTSHQAPENSKTSPKSCAFPQTKRKAPLPEVSNVHLIVSKTKDVPETLDELENVVAHCRDFLYGHFGLPRYSGTLKVIFTTNPADNGRMIWKQSNSKTRKILLNSLNLYCDKESTLWGIIVHELFHGLYQSEGLIKNSPEFILEAQASYAQYLSTDYFINGKASNKRIYKQLEKKYQGTQCNRSTRLDLSSRFSAYGQCSTDQLYLLGAIMYANPENGISAVKQTLQKGNGKASSVLSWASEYNIRVANSPLAEHLILKQSYASEHTNRATEVAYEKTDPQPVPQGMVPRQNVEIQRLLHHLGLYGGKIDGVLGKNTYKAIRLFQYQNKMKPTGILDDDTLDLLFERGVEEGLWK